MQKAKRLFYHVEQFSRMVGSTIINLPAFIRYHRSTLDQMNHLGYASIFLVMAASIMIGMVLALEWEKTGTIRCQTAHGTYYFHRRHS